jgi:hypothetical protein
VVKHISRTFASQRPETLPTAQWQSFSPLPSPSDCHSFFYNEFHVELHYLSFCGTCNRISALLRLKNILLHNDVTFCLCIHLWMDAWFASVSGLFTWMWKYLCGSLPSILLHTYWGVGLLDHMLILCLIFWRISIWFHSSCIILHFH